MIFDADQWLSVLELAHKYDMIRIREVALRGLKSANPPLPPAKQLACARRYNCDELADAPFQVLSTRAEPLSKDEMAQLPLDDLYRVVVAREQPFLWGKRCANCKACNCWCLRLLGMRKEAEAFYRQYHCRRTQSVKEEVVCQPSWRGTVSRGRNREVSPAHRAPV